MILECALNTVKAKLILDRRDFKVVLRSGWFWLNAVFRVYRI